MTGIVKQLTLKPDSIKEPDLYLYATISEFQIPSEEDKELEYAMSSYLYVKSKIETVQTEL